ncbi:AsmA-like C-terminal domain-containing protein, partial [Pelagibacteraceae bacterium]|nr:AsmA-like C-terminal domain-containing protein [Pelagibacteraceae bacterium]
DLKKIFTKLSIPIGNFILLGKIENGKLVKISSKSEFSKDKFLDISLKTDAKSKKKIIEIFSDLPKPILADYKVFNSIQGGKLLFTSTFDDEVSKSNLIIEDFKIINAPGFAKLLTLADFGGVADLLSGEGISFHTLDIKFESSQEKTEIKELYSVGPSISILMDGYIEKKSSLVSFRGTMIPAKELNKLISKIPILGNILIGKELGEGIFGVSFKIKGLPGKTKTTVNPIKTLTPRFITRALEKRKKK